MMAPDATSLTEFTVDVCTWLGFCAKEMSARMKFEQNNNIAVTSTAMMLKGLVYCMVASVLVESRYYLK